MTSLPEILAGKTQTARPVIADTEEPKSGVRLAQGLIRQLKTSIVFSISTPLALFLLIWGGVRRKTAKCKLGLPVVRLDWRMHASRFNSGAGDALP